MQVILLEKVAKLGSVGSLVKVKDGYGRNFLIPRKKAVPATAANVKMFEAKRAEIEKENAAKKAVAEKSAASMDNVMVSLIRQAGEDGKLFGSVSARDIAAQLAAKKFDIAASSIHMDKPIKYIGIHAVRVELHAEVQVTVQVNVARSEDEAREAIAKHKSSETASSEQDA